MWSNLNIKQKSDLMKIYLQNGVSSLDTMKEHYNKFASGGDKPPFNEWYNTVPSDRNDTTNYNLRKAYENIPFKQIERWKNATVEQLNNVDYHLPSVIKNSDGSYDFLKSKNHPSVKYEIDWYNSPEGASFKKDYQLDTTETYYKYIPRNKNIFAPGGNLYTDGEDKGKEYLVDLTRPFITEKKDDDVIKWFENWYGNRKDIIAENIRNNNYNYSSEIDQAIAKYTTSEEERLKAANAFVNNIPYIISNTNEYARFNLENNVYGIKPVEEINSREEDFLKSKLRKYLDEETLKTMPLNRVAKNALIGAYGVYYPSQNFILYQEGDDDVSIIHERTHSLQKEGPGRSIQQSIYNRGTVGTPEYKNPLKEGIKSDSYLDQSAEIQSRLNEFRYVNKINPKHVFTIEEIRELLKDDKYQLDRYNDEFLLHLFNEVAENKGTSNPNMLEVNYARNGGFLNKFQTGGEKDKIQKNRFSLLDKKKIYDRIIAREWDTEGNAPWKDGVFIGGMKQYFFNPDTAAQHAVDKAKEELKEAEKAGYNYLTDEDAAKAMSYLAHEDAKDFYLGMPQRTGLVVPSLHKPTISKNPNEKYYKFKHQTPEYWSYEINNIIKDNIYKNKDNDKYKEKQIYGDNTLNNHTVTYGVDPKKGPFVSFYDTWDYNTKVLGAPGDNVGWIIGGKPFDIYDKIYLDDYYGVNTAPEQGTYFGAVLPEIWITPDKVDFKNGGNLFYNGGKKGKWWQLDAEKIYNRVPAHENELGRETYNRYMVARRLPIYEGARNYYKNGDDDYAENLYDYYLDIVNNPYSEEVVEEYLSKYPKSHFQVYNEEGLDTYSTANNIREYAQAYLGHEDAKAKYLGFPQRGNTIIESNYKPTKATNPNNKYYKFNYQDSDYWNLVVDDMVNHNKDTSQYVDRTLNTFTASKGVDPNKGEYISIYDIWDYNPAVWGGGKDRLSKYVNGKPFEIYDRVYLDDYFGINTTPEKGTYYGKWLPELRVVDTKE